MGRSATKTDVYLEIGKKKVIAGAMEWPGWCRGGRDEASALQALLDYGPRYAQVLRSTRTGFHAPTDIDAFSVVDRLKGNATTDYGVPDFAPSSDAEPIDADELRRLQTILRACWRALDKAVEAAAGKELRKGPRGGGRDLDKIVEHVVGAEEGYVRRLAWKLERPDDLKPDELASMVHDASLKALAAGAQGELPERGPRGGAIWLPRYFVRRVAWHVLDHVWEIEDRAI